MQGERTVLGKSASVEIVIPKDIAFMAVDISAFGAVVAVSTALLIRSVMHAYPIGA